MATKARRVTRVSGDARWWKAPKGEAHDTIHTVVKSIHEKTRWLWSKDRYHAELYEGEGALDENPRGKQWAGSTLPYNVVRKAIDTLTARTATERHLPQCYTNRGDWGLQKRAKKQSEAIEGEFYRQKFYEKRVELWVKDALRSRAGLLRVTREHARPVIDRVLPWELYFDPTDAKYGDPRCVYHVRTIDAGVLEERFPSKAKAIRAAAKKGLDDLDWDTGASSAWEATTVDRVRIIDAYHLPSGPDATDGRWITCLGADETLQDVPWKRDYFPYESLIYTPRSVGVWGYPLAEVLEGYQFEINVMSEKLQEAHHILGGGICFVSTTSGIVDSHIDNSLGVIVRHKPGEVPTFVNPDPVNAQTYQRHRDLNDDALRDSGVSDMSAHSEKPSGNVSGVLADTLIDVETQRFAMFERRLQAACVGVAEKLLDEMREIAEEEGDYEVTHNGRRGRRTLSWTKDFGMERDGYHLQVQDTSFLSKQPSERFAQLEQLLATGKIDDATFFRLARFPDLEAYSDTRLAPMLRVHDQVQAMLEAEPEDGKDFDDFYKYPDPYLDLKYAQSYAQNQLNLAIEGEAPEGVLDLLRQYIEDAKAEWDKANPPPAPPPPMPPGPPMPMDPGMPVGPGMPGPGGPPPGSPPLDPTLMQSPPPPMMS